MSKPGATAERFQITSAQAAVDIAKALEAASFEHPLTMADMARVIAKREDKEWTDLQAGQRKWYWQRARHIIDCLHFVGGRSVAQGQNGKVTVYFLIDPP